MLRSITLSLIKSKIFTVISEEQLIKKFILWKTSLFIESLCNFVSPRSLKLASSICQTARFPERNPPKSIPFSSWKAKQHTSEWSSHVKFVILAHSAFLSPKTSINPKKCVKNYNFTFSCNENNRNIFFGFSDCNRSNSLDNIVNFPCFRVKFYNSIIVHKYVQMTFRSEPNRLLTQLSYVVDISVAAINL